MASSQQLHSGARRKLQYWLQHQSPFLSAAVGAVLGLGIGAGALFGLEGIVGAGVCMLVLGAAFWVAKDAEPVLVGVDISPEAGGRGIRNRICSTA